MIHVRAATRSPVLRNLDADVSRPSGVHHSAAAISPRVMTVSVPRCSTTARHRCALRPCFFLLPIGTGAMRRAVGLARERFSAAEEEIGATGIADRPPASAVVQFEQRAALRGRDIRIHERIVDVGLGVPDPGRELPLAARELAGDIVLALHHKTGIIALGPPRTAIGRHLRDAEAMNLSEHGTTADAGAQFPRDALGRGALRPKRSHELDAFVGPRRRRISAHGTDDRHPHVTRRPKRLGAVIFRIHDYITTSCSQIVNHQM